MSFRLFIYYCAAWGGAAAFLGWLVGCPIEWGFLAGVVKGVCLGLFVTLGLGMVDALAAGTHRDRIGLAMRLALALPIGAFGGLAGGLLGQLVDWWMDGTWTVLLVPGWIGAGVLIGAAPFVFDFLSGIVRREDLRPALARLRNGLIGGAVGGLVGGIVSVVIRSLWGVVFRDADARSLWSANATEFVALGAGIGLAVALVQIVLRDAALRVESGAGPDRQLLLTRSETSIGRAASCEVDLGDDTAVEPVHAKITRQDAGWVLADAGTPEGTLLNGQRLAAPTPLRSGDRIQVGGSVLLFEGKTREVVPAVLPAAP
jgi:hypothetical protein